MRYKRFSRPVRYHETRDAGKGKNDYAEEGRRACVGAGSHVCAQGRPAWRSHALPAAIHRTAGQGIKPPAQRCAEPWGHRR